ncbi:hypothetical protein [Lichenibacterium dinghuense]|uniref:hypothetical protein n=1 Tax=Lichenibacterium dinghuense TaxID=2895977 RepID=UPI001F433570|nr:hypothetical protein [Lichenibacterium sp. 6Y81]
MHILRITAAALLIASPLAVTAGSANAATAHNSQAGGFGASSNAGDSTVSSRHVKHSAKHMRKTM